MKDLVSHTTTNIPKNRVSDSHMIFPPAQFLYTGTPARTPWMGQGRLRALNRPSRFGVGPLAIHNSERGGRAPRSVVWAADYRAAPSQGPTSRSGYTPPSHTTPAHASAAHSPAPPRWYLVLFGVDISLSGALYPQWPWPPAGVLAAPDAARAGRGW